MWILTVKCNNRLKFQTDIEWKGRKGQARTSASVEDADASVSAVMNLIPPQRGVAVRLDPHPGHGVVKDFIVLDKAQTCEIKQQDFQCKNTQ